jgi:hypothetical protein
MKTATIDYEDFEVLAAAAAGAVATLEGALPVADAEQQVALRDSISLIRASLERAAKGVVVGVRAQSFQDRLSEAIAAARANAVK